LRNDFLKKKNSDQINKMEIKEEWSSLQNLYT